jgi:small subunit ribosomal protein S1
MQNINIPRVGQIVEGNVIKVEDNTLYVDLNAMTEGKIHLDNYAKPAPQTFIGLIAIGDTVKARIQKITDEPAQILLSRLPLIEEESFKKLEEAVKNESVVSATVKKADEKGLLLNIEGFEAFLPYSHLDYDLVKNKEQLRGKKLEVQLLEATKRGRFQKIIASRKKIFEQARQEAYDARIKAREEALQQIKTGDVLKGIVDKIEAYAATVKFGHVAGLLRISQVSHYRIDQLEDVLAVGQEVEVKVIKKEGNRLDLSVKALMPTPYEEYAKVHHKGETVEGTVVQKLPFGIIVELDRDIRGLLHQSEFSWNPNDNYDAYVKIGETIPVGILSIDVKKEKIALSRRVLLDNPWKDVTVRRGDVIQVPITGIERNMILVNVQGADGIIKQDELSIDRVAKIDELFTVGDSVEAIVLVADKNTWTMELSIKRVKEKELRADFEKFMEQEKVDESGTNLGELFEDKFKKKK